MLLPRVNFILSEIKLFVAAQSPDYSSNDDGRSTEGFDDDDQFHYDECSDLEWDNNYQDYYHLYYDYDEDGRDDEEKAPTCREECVIDGPTCHEEHVIDFSGFKLMSTTSGPSVDLMSKLLTAMKSLAPNSIFLAEKSKKRRKRKLMKKVHPELRVVWQNFGNIFPSQSDDDKESSIYPQINWSVVNKCFLSNYPSPSPQPIHGCSESPEFYQDVMHRSDYGYMTNLGSKFSKEFPFGSSLGYKTSAGAVAVSCNVFHGHVYDPIQGWILHAKFPEKRKTQEMERKKTKRKKNK